MIMKCSLCSGEARFDFGFGSMLCAECTDAMLERCEISNPEGRVRDGDHCQAPASVVAVADVSIPECLRRDANNRPPFARAPT